MSAANKLECDGRVAIVTGSSRGIGAAIAERLAESGAKVACSARTIEPVDKYEGSLQETVERITASGGEAIAIRADLNVPDDRAALVEQTVELLGPVDILVNNGAITYYMPFTEFTEKRWRLMFEVQVRAPYELGQMVVPGMVERGQGWILNISSRAGVHPPGPPFDPVHREWGFSVYGMVKGALDRFSTGLAAELYDDGIRVNSLAPWDNVATPGASTHDLVDDFKLEDVSLMAEAALALCSGPTTLTGNVAYSQPLLAQLQRRPPPLG
jgi:NAD(P)-dependent dehydrogenase (short-subunit alcohol dehydrogenase family)